MMPQTPTEMLYEFENVMGGPVDQFRPPRDLIALRARLIREEAEEVREELVAGLRGALHREALAKELADLLYVVYGTGVAFGIDLDEALREVHRSNLSKLDDRGRPIVDAGGKVLKGPNYHTPNMATAANTPTESTAELVSSS